MGQLEETRKLGAAIQCFRCASAANGGCEPTPSFVIAQRTSANPLLDHLRYTSQTDKNKLKGCKKWTLLLFSQLLGCSYPFCF
jgi:hypothetical protein